MADDLLKEKLNIIKENQMMQFTKEELAQYNGKDGNPAYVAVNDVVYDVSPKPSWADGDHFGGVVAGKDVTVQYNECHAAFAILRRLEIVGELIK